MGLVSNLEGMTLTRLILTDIFNLYPENKMEADLKNNIKISVIPVMNSNNKAPRQ